MCVSGGGLLIAVPLPGGARTQPTQSWRPGGQRGRRRRGCAAACQRLEDARGGSVSTAGHRRAQAANKQRRTVALGRQAGGQSNGEGHGACVRGEEARGVR